MQLDDWNEEAIERLEEALLDDEAGRIILEITGPCCWYIGIFILLVLLLLSILVYLIGK